MQNSLITSDSRQTQSFGEKFAKNVNVGDVILFTGELGAGKTTFVQGVAKGLNVKARIISPTFVLVRKHRGKIDRKQVNLYHIDLYRLESSHEISGLGLEDIFEDTNGIFLIEWGDKHEGLKSSWEVKIDALTGNKRKITIKRNE